MKKGEKGNLWNLSQYSFLKIKGLLELSWNLFADEENEKVRPYFIRKNVEEAIKMRSFIV